MLAAGSVLGTAKVAAQASPNYYGGGPAPTASPTTTLTPAQPEDAAPAATTPGPATGGGLVSLRGIVTGSATHKGLAGVMVLLKGTNSATLTDTTGAFALRVAAGPAPMQLAISSIGHNTQEATTTPGQLLAVVLAPDMHVLMGEVVITKYKSPWPWHARPFFSWST